MPETPDFDQIARSMADYLVDEEDIRVVTEQLRQVWNARGAADIAKLEALEVVPYYVNEDALRTLDR